MTRSDQVPNSFVHIRQGVKDEVNRGALDQPRSQRSGLGAAKELCCHSKVTKTKAQPMRSIHSPECASLSNLLSKKFMFFWWRRST
jgi:hypothetical protein